MSTDFTLSEVQQTIREEMQNIFNTPMNQFVTGMDVGNTADPNGVTYTTTVYPPGDNPPVWMNPNTFTVQPMVQPMMPWQPFEVQEPVIFGPLTFGRHSPDVEVIQVPEECELLLHANRHRHELAFTFKGPTIEQAAGALGPENIQDTLLRLDREFKLAIARAFKLVPVSEVKNKRMLILED